MNKQIKNNNISTIEKYLSKSQDFKFLQRESFAVCDPFFTPNFIYSQVISEEEIKKLEEQFEICNSFYESEIKQDKLRYPLILEMQLKKKELEENPIIFDKEESYYENDPHKLVNFDENFTPFFEHEANEIFFRNLKDPIRIKWEEIPEIDRRQKIVHFEEAIRKLQYDEVQLYCEEYLLSKDIVILFLQYLPTFWPARKFINTIKKYVVGFSPAEVYNFFIEKILILSSCYKLKNEKPTTIEGQKAAIFLYMANALKKKLYKELISCLKEDSTSDILSDFIDKYDLFNEPIYPDVSRVYKFKEIAKLVVLFNLSFFNLFPIENNKEFEKLREINKPLFLTFLWYLKDLYWKDYGSPLKVKEDIKNYFIDEDYYQKLNNLIESYPIRIVAFKEYFYTHHDVILREEVQRKLAIYDREKEREEKEKYRFNADFYVLNKELQAYEKVKEKIYSKFRKLGKSDQEIKVAIEKAYKEHLRKQKHLSKYLFKKKSVNEKPITENRTIISFYVNDKIETKTYEELIKETTELFINTLKNFNLYDEIAKNHIDDEPKVYPESNIYVKIFKNKHIEPNFWNKFKDYCFIAIDKYPAGIKPISEFYIYQKEFIIEYLRDIMGFFGYNEKLPKGVIKRILTNSKRKRKV